MSVTRYIDADTATQVNSSLIGVGVRPEPSSITFKYTYQYVKTVSGDVYYIEGDDRPYKQDPESPGFITYEGDRYYSVICAVAGQGSIKYYFYVSGQRWRPPVEGTQFYTVTGTDPIVFEVAGVCTGTDTLEEVIYPVVGPEEGGYIPLEGGELNTATGEIEEDGDLVDYAEGVHSDLVDISASFIRRDGGAYLFECTDTGDVPIEGVEVFTDGKPVIGGEVEFFDDVYVAAPSYVSGVVDGDLSCSVEFSVDGKTWTQAGDEDLTDANNVIANVPRYVYLRFSQDVEITEE